MMVPPSIRLRSGCVPAIRMLLSIRNPPGGAFSVPAPGDFDVSFSSLALECSGDVGGGRMDVEACDELDNNDNGVVDENCDERLLAWRTPISVRNAEFKRVIEGGGSRLVTLGLIALNVFAFLIELSRPSAGALQSFVQAWGVVPWEYTAQRDLAPGIPLPFWTTLFSSMFLHGGWAHLLGNMLYLWIFGDNLEHAMGRARFLVFYLVCGVAAGLAHIAFNSGSTVPTVGASGAISGILGGYLVLFPGNRVRVLTSGGVAAVPAVYMLGFWILIQVLNGAGSFANTPASRGSRGRPFVAAWSPRTARRAYFSSANATSSAVSVRVPTVKARYCLPPCM